jgi:glycolate oxidase FAD binding subunit
VGAVKCNTVITVTLRCGCIFFLQTIVTLAKLFLLDSNVLPSFTLISQTLASLVGETAVIAEANWPVSLKQQVALATTLESQPTAMVLPNTQAELASVVACAAEQQWAILPCGRGTKLSWGGLAQGADLLLSTEKLNRLIDHAAGDLTVTVEAGMGFAQLQAQLVKAGQWVALDPIYGDRATVGGVIATRSAGSLRHRYGGVRDMLLGANFILADGQQAKAGGRVVKNVAGYDLMKLLTGSFGSLGIITEVSLRLYPLPESSETVLLTGEADAIATAIKILLASTLTPTVVDLIATHNLSANSDSTKIPGKLELLIRFQGLAASVSQQRDRLLEIAKSHDLQSIDLSETEYSQKFDWVSQNASASDGSIFCQSGVLPSLAVKFLKSLQKLDLRQMEWNARIHLGSGLGSLRMRGEEAELGIAIAQTRTLCQQSQGFLTILEAPVTLKQSLDVWGYTGNALAAMQKIKQKFDPHHQLSPHRFVGGM